MRKSSVFGHSILEGPSDFAAPELDGPEAVDDPDEALPRFDPDFDFTDEGMLLRRDD